MCVLIKGIGIDLIRDDIGRFTSDRWQINTSRQNKDDMSICLDKNQ
jgi:hypothetical protein